ncbi:heavy-metal-associated domain-containing protein [Magnetospirillum sp. UT-4]|uniref:heavy-metal-associated domain-containing protein n=1 Tax=Magnetospirillum sp. UT-4 TaxID=2681467 RepID=UPI001385D73A|nr:heavy-metal-associated domain-containing protein [Magnetospirillum sp. UT-4]CAA7613476.1 Heavy metal transport/detoxification protein [Magnetospirillum sp. UT-4]
MAAKYLVSGMTCGGCARSVESAIKTEAPGASVSVDLPTATVTVDGADETQVKKAVDEAGFTFLGAA